MAATDDVAILIVDDESIITRVVARHLSVEGYQTVEVGNAHEALTRLSGQSFALMVTDICMPEMDGIELLRQTHENYPDMMTIMLTGVSEVETAIQAMRQGAFDYLFKPISFDALSLSIQRALDHRNLLLQNRDYQQNLERKVEERTQLLTRQHQHLQKLHGDLESSFFDMIRVFIELIELYEPFLGAHVKRVAALSITLARMLKLPEEQVRTIEMGALLHDIGLVGISPHLMLKRRLELSTQEFELIKQGPEYGQRVLASIPRLQQVGRIIRAQHEHFNGKGFPDGLKGQQIPYEARLIAVTNAYDAMRFKRHASQSLTAESALTHLQQMTGKQFDPAIVKGFVWVLSDQESEPDSSEVLAVSEPVDPSDYRNIQYREIGSGLGGSKMECRRVAVSELRAGMRVARAVCTDAGATLIRTGTVLTDPTVAKLRQCCKQQLVRPFIYVSECSFSPVVR